MTYCKIQIQKHSLVQTVNFLENNEATRLKAEQSQKVTVGQQPHERPKRALSF